MPPVVLASSVRAVTVYRRGALVTREATLAHEAVVSPSGLKGTLPDEVMLEGLPLTLDDSSLRLEVVGSDGEGGAALPVASDVRVTIAVPRQDPSLPPPDDAELDAAKLELAKLQRELYDLQEAFNRAARLTPGQRGEPEEGKPPQASPTVARLELLSFRRERSQKLAEQIADATERHRLAKVRCDTLEERKRIASAARNVRTHEVRKAAMVRIEAPKQGQAPRELTIRVHYFVPGARWAPAYTVRLSREMTEGVLELRAMVGQATGEDWKNVALTLSTASPQQWTELPELKALKIGRAQPEPIKAGWRPPPVGAGELYADYDRDLERPSTRTGGRPVAAPKPAAPPASTTEMFDLDGLMQEHAKGAMREERARQAPPPPPSFAPPPPAPGAPMPMPSAPPAPQRMASPAYAEMPMAAAKRSRGGIGSVLGGAVGAVAGAAAMAFGGGGSADTGMFPLDDDELSMDEPHEPAMVAGRELLDYGRLRLFDAEDRERRGSLRRIDRRTLYQQISVTSVAIDEALIYIDATIGSANAFERRSAPARHSFPSGEAGFDYAYVADAPIDLVSDGQFHAIALRADESEAKPRYISVPRETQDVFQIVALRNPLNAPLLPGPADVYVGGRFQLSSDIELTPVGGRIELGLGVEQSIKIARNVKYSEDTSGMFKRQIALLHELEIEISNNLSRAATVEVRERLSTVPDGQDEIQLGVREVSPSWDDFEQKQHPLEGGKLWKVEVPAGDKRKLRAAWTITIPNQHELIGGNRRES